MCKIIKDFIRRHVVSPFPSKYNPKCYDCKESHCPHNCVYLDKDYRD